MKLKWLIFSISGLILIGFGLSLLGEAIILKYEKKPFFWLGTFALIIVNAGLCFFGSAIRYRIQIDRSK